MSGPDRNWSKLSADLAEAAALEDTTERQGTTLAVVHTFLLNGGIDADLLIGLRELTGALGDKQEAARAASTNERQALLGTASAIVTLLMRADLSESEAVKRVGNKLIVTGLSNGSLRSARKKAMTGRGKRGNVARDVYQRVLRTAEKEHPRKAAEVLLEGLTKLHRK